MEKMEEGGYSRLTPEQFETGVSFARARRLPVEYGTHRDMEANLHIIPATDEDPTTPEWDEQITAEFEAELTSAQ